MSVYYNDNGAFCCAWLRESMKEGLIPDGVIDNRSIRDVDARDVEGFAQVHFFAGIGGWPYALRLAQWGERPVWTGSCPCQPFSAAGKRQGTADERHLWPDFYRLIAECRPATVFGEQVASKDGLAWLDGVRADLEGAGYAFGAADLCAAGAGEEAQGRISYEDNTFRWERIIVGAPHIRQRLYWVADAASARCHGALARAEGEAWDETRMFVLSERGPARGLGVPNGDGSFAGQQTSEAVGYGRSSEPASHAGGLEHAARDGRSEWRPEPSGRGIEPRCKLGGMGDAERHGWQQGAVEVRARQSVIGRAGNQFWSDFDIIPCLDGKARRTGPGIFPLAHGVPNRVGALRGAGNAIVPQVAAAFIRAFLES